MTTYTPPNEKANVVEAELGAHSDRVGDVDRIDAKATAPGLTMASFAHLDEKKILRKVSFRNRSWRPKILTTAPDGHPSNSHVGPSLSSLFPRP